MRKTLRSCISTDQLSPTPVNTGDERVVPANRGPKGPSKAEFDRIFQKGIATRCATVRLLSHHGSGLVGIAVAKKLGSHPVRNKLKRRCREAVRASLNLVLGERDYVIVVGQEAAKANQPKLAEDLATALTQLNARSLPANEDPKTSRQSAPALKPSTPLQIPQANNPQTKINGT